MVDIWLTGLGRVDRQHNNVGTVEVGFGGAETLVSGARGVAALKLRKGRPECKQSRRHRKAVGFQRMLHQPHQRGMLIIGEVKIRHSGDMRSSSRRVALYHGFLEQTVTSVTVTSLLQQGYSGQRSVRECSRET